MLMSIKKIHGFDLMYDPQNQKFILRNEKQEEMGKAKTQELAEVLAKKLSKEKFSPIPAFRDCNLKPCTITSVNREEKSCWFTLDEKTKWGEKRGKEHFQYSSSLFARTEANKKIRQEVIDLNKQIEGLEQKRDNLLKKRESVIDCKFFGIKDD